MTATTAAAKKQPKNETPDDDDDEVDEYAEMQEEMNKFLKSSGGAAFKVCWDRFLESMLDEIRGEIADAHGRIDYVIDRLPDDDELVAFVENTIATSGKAALFVDALLVKFGAISKDSDGKVTLTDAFPEELKSDYGELIIAMSSLHVEAQELHKNLTADPDAPDEEGDDATAPDKGEA